MPNTETVQLGDRTLPVVPQKHARLRHHLNGEDFNALFSRDYSAVGYRLLSVLIPSIKVDYPEWEFDGFTSETDWLAYKGGDRDAYDEENDPSPTTDQIVGALEKALSVNGAGRLGKLLSLIQTAGDLQKQQASVDQRMPLSPASPGENGGSPSTTTGTTAPTSSESGD